MEGWKDSRWLAETRERVWKGETGKIGNVALKWQELARVYVGSIVLEMSKGVRVMPRCSSTHYFCIRKTRL